MRKIVAVGAALLGLIGASPSVAADVWQCEDSHGHKYEAQQVVSSDTCVGTNMYGEKVTHRPSTTPWTGAPPEVAEAERRLRESTAENRKKGGVLIGMTEAEVIASSWGTPDDINRTTTARGTREQWVYGGGNYLYFENGRLTAVQN